MIVAAVKIHQLLVTQVGNVFRVAAAVVVVGGTWKQLLAEFLPEGAGHRAHGAFHLVEDHAFEHQVAFRVIRLGEFHPVALLGEVQGIQPGEEHGIQVHLQQVVEVLAVLAGERVGGPV